MGDAKANRARSGHDVFLSYARNNAVLARAVFKFLRSAGLRVWFDEKSVPPDTLWMAATARGVAQARHLLILLSESTPPAWQRAEFDFAARAAARHPNLEIVPLIREGFEPDPAFVEWLERYDPVWLPSDKAALEEHLRGLVDRLSAPPGMPAMPPQAQGCPYPGLLPYGLSEARAFFGRERELIEATSRLGEQAGGAAYTRWLRVEGPSGIGKTSFVRAGLAPAVVRGAVAGAPGDWRVLALRPSDQPLEALAAGLAHTFAHSIEAGELGELLSQPAGLADLVREHLPADQGLLLVLDHLDDVVDAQRQAPQAVAQLDALLADALGDFDRRLLLLTTARTDLVASTLAALPRCAEQGRACGAVIELGGFTRAGLRTIIEGPPRLVGRPLPADLSARLRRDAERWSAVPARLSWMLTTLYEGGRATLKRYDELGGLEQGLAQALDHRFEQLDDDAQSRARALLTALVSGGRGRRDHGQVLTYEEAVIAAGMGPRAEALVDGLGQVEAGAPPLVQITRDGALHHVRLANEALLSVWPRLRAWIDADRAVLERRADVEAAALAWHAAGTPAAELPQGPLLFYLQGGDLSAAQRARLRASLRTRTRHFVEQASAAQQARSDAEAQAERAKIAREQATHEAARRRAASHVLRLRLVVLLGFGAAAVAGYVAWRAGQREAELAEQVRYAATQRAEAVEAMRQAEAQHVAAEKSRKAAERDRTLVERERRAADKLGAQAQQSADTVLSFAIEAALEADTYFSRVPGRDGEYARRTYAQAVIERLRKRVAIEPDNRRLRFLLARQHTLLGDLLADVGRHRGARPEYEKAVEVLGAALQEADPLADRVALETLAHAHTAIGRYLSNPRRGPDEPAKAVAHHQQAIASWKRLIDAAPKDEGLIAQLADANADLAVALLRKGEPKAARPVLEASVARSRALLQVQPSDVERIHALARRLGFLADAELATDSGAQAIAHYDEAMRLLDPFQLGTPESRPLERTRAQIKRRRKAARAKLKGN